MKSAIIIALLSTTFLVNAQISTELFKSLDDFKNSNPITDTTIKIEKRTKNQIFMSGGNDFKFYSPDKTLNKELKREYFAVKRNDSLFINCFQLQLGFWYAYAEKIGDKLFFTGAITMNKEQQEKLALTSYVLGPIGGGISAGKLALLRFYYTMNLNSGETTYLSKEKMIDLISIFPELVEKYKTEIEPENIETQKKYIQEYKLKMTN